MSDMSTEDFLRRVVPANGNWVTMCWIGTRDTGDSFTAHRSYAINNKGFAEAAGMITWAANNLRQNTYYAFAAYKTAEPQKTRTTNRDYMRARRIKDNVQLIKAFVIDADVRRPGDGKGNSKAFIDRPACITWLKDFYTAIGWPRPNLAVDSGYGYHFYWLFDTPIPRDQWEPYADAMKEAMVAHGFTGDLAPTFGAERILRPPGSYNYKVAASPMMVRVVGADADYKLDQLTPSLLAYMTDQSQVRQRAGTGTHGSARVIPLLGPRPDGVNPEPEVNPADDPSAYAGSNREFLFERIHPQCEQMKLSYATQGGAVVNGNAESHDYWRLYGTVPILTHCTDGDAFIHPMSSGWHKYNAAAVDQIYADAKANRKGHPSCAKIDVARPGVCDTCAFKGKISTPLVLGEVLPAIDPDELPFGFRRRNGWIQRQVSGSWRGLVEGDFTGARIEMAPTSGTQLVLTYTLGRHTSTVAVHINDCGSAQLLQSSLGAVYVNVDHTQAKALGVLFVAWMTKLQKVMPAPRANAYAYGWNTDNGTMLGFALAGTLYHADGTTSQVVGDKSVQSLTVTTYHTSGRLASWRAAAALFEQGSYAHPGLQAIIAGSFGAPLMGLVPHIKGMTVNVWSPASGVGKTAAMQVAQAIWGNPTRGITTQTTYVAMMLKLGGTRSLPQFWDEFWAFGEEQRKLVTDVAFMMPAGTDKQRATADVKLRAAAYWETLLFTACNRAICDLVSKENDGTDAGMLRVLDVEIPRITHTPSPKDAAILENVMQHYGHAGVAYAQFLATNVGQIKADITQLLEIIYADMQLTNEERFFAATIAAIVLGARYARKLGLFLGDPLGIYALFKQIVADARAARQGVSIVRANGALNVGVILTRYLSDYSDRTLRTNTVGQGNRGTKVIVYEPQPRRPPMAVQIASDGVLLLDRRVFESWLTENHYPTQQTLRQMQAAWNAKTVGVTLGGGTVLSVGQRACIEIRKGHPDTDPIFDTGRGP